MEILQPSGAVMFLVEGYFDESGALEVAPSIFCISGYFIPPAAAQLMDAEWLQVLEKYQVDFFHMVDCAPGNEGFQHLNKNERSDLVIELMGLIKKYTIEGFSVFARAESYRQKALDQDVYTECASTCVTAMRHFMKDKRLEGNIAYFFEAGHPSDGSAYNHIAGKLKRSEDSVTFADKRKVRLLQAADLLAWQSTKYAKDWFYPRLDGKPEKRAIRKDFASLMEHPHMFMHTHMDGGEKTMGIEIWPLSLRSQTLVKLEVGSNGPIPFLRETGSATPIIPVLRTLGWKEGHGGIVYIGCEGLGDKTFNLSFDEARLLEAISYMLAGLTYFKDSKLNIGMLAESVLVEGDDSKMILRIKLHHGPTVGLHLPPDVVARLKEALLKN